MSQALMLGSSSELIAYHHTPAHSQLPLSPFLKYAEHTSASGIFTCCFFTQIALHSFPPCIYSSVMPSLTTLYKITFSHSLYFPISLTCFFSPLHNTNILFTYTFIWLLSAIPCPTPMLLEEHKLYKQGRELVLCFLLYTQCQEWRLAFGRCSINICLIKECYFFPQTMNIHCREWKNAGRYKERTCTSPNIPIINILLNFFQVFLKIYFFFL